MIKSRRIQFSLRSLLLLMTLSAIGIVVYQLATGPNLNHRLLEAMKNDRVLAIRFYLWLGADPNNGIRGDSGYGWTPIQSAAFYGDSIFAKHLIAAGANVNYLEKDGFTAMVYAAEEGHWDIVEMLYDAGADHRATGADGKRVVDYAIATGRSDIVELLTSDLYPAGFWAVETIVTPEDVGDDGLPYNRWIQVYRSDRAEPTQWPFAAGVRRFTSFVETDANGKDQTVRGVVSVQILEDQNWIEVTYADGSTNRMPL